MVVWREWLTTLVLEPNWRRLPESYGSWSFTSPVTKMRWWCSQCQCSMAPLSPWWLGSPWRSSSWILWRPRGSRRWRVRPSPGCYLWSRCRWPLWNGGIFLTFTHRRCNSVVSADKEREKSSESVRWHSWCPHPPPRLLTDKKIMKIGRNLCHKWQVGKLFTDLTLNIAQNTDVSVQNDMTDLWGINC